MLCARAGEGTLTSLASVMLVITSANRDGERGETIGDPRHSYDNRVVRDAVLHVVEIRDDHGAVVTEAGDHPMRQLGLRDPDHLAWLVWVGDPLLASDPDGPPLHLDLAPACRETVGHEAHVLAEPRHIVARDAVVQGVGRNVAIGQHAPLDHVHVHGGCGDVEVCV